MLRCGVGTAVCWIKLQLCLCVMYSQLCQSQRAWSESWKEVAVSTCHGDLECYPTWVLSRKRLSFWQAVVFLHEAAFWELWPGHNLLAFAGEEREQKCCGNSSAPLPNAGSVCFLKCVKCLEKCQNRQTYLSEAMAGLRLCAAVSQHLDEFIGCGWALGAGLSPFQQAAGEEAQQKTHSQHLVDTQCVGSLAAAPAEVLLLLPEADSSSFWTCVRK